MKNRSKGILGLLILLIVCAVLLSSCDTVTENKIVSAEIKKNGDEISVSATLTDDYLAQRKDGKIYLLAVSSTYTESIKNPIVLKENKAKSRLSFRIPTVTPSGDSLLTYAFVLAEKDTAGSFRAVTNAMYVQNSEILATSAKRPARASSPKGLSTSDPYEADILGAEHILLEAKINELMLPAYSAGAIHYVYHGISYYFDAEEITELDKLVGESSSLNLRIYLRTALEWDDSEDRITTLYCPQSSSSRKGYLPNMEDPAAAGYVGAFYSFLSSRYSGEHGVALDYLIGNHANDFGNGCHAGSYSSDRALANYLSWVRTAYNEITSHNKNGSVYLPINNQWRSEDSSALGSKVFLTSFSELAKASGDFPFRIALDLGRGQDLPSILAGEGRDFSTVGVNNLSDLIALLNSESMLYNESPRTLIIDRLSLPHTISEANRAAYYAYAYYKAAEAGIDALIYDGRDEESGLLNSAGTRTGFYYAFLMCGSNVTDQLSDYTEKIRGGKLPSMKDYKTRELVYEQEVKTEVSRAILSNKKDFPVSLREWIPAAACYVAELGRPQENGTQALTLKGSPTSSHVAVSHYEIPAEKILESGYVGITMSSRSPETVTLLITKRGDGQAISSAYVGEVSTTGAETTYYFNISPFTDTLRSSDVLTVSICASPNGASRDTELTVREIALYGTSGNGSSTFLTVIVVMLCTLAVCGLLFILTQRRKRLRSYDND